MQIDEITTTEHREVESTFDDDGSTVNETTTTTTTIPVDPVDESTDVDILAAMDEKLDRMMQAIDRRLARLEQVNTQAAPVAPAPAPAAPAPAPTPAVSVAEGGTAIPPAAPIPEATETVVTPTPAVAAEATKRKHAGFFW